jgi:hypothetical protein
MQIGEVAERTALTVDAIRFYERRNLLPKAGRSVGGGIHPAHAPCWRRQLEERNENRSPLFSGMPELPARSRANRESVASESQRAEIRSVAINNDAEAIQLMFQGSPTIRVDGEDIEPDQKITPGLRCRLYANRSGVPSEEMLRLALSRAKKQE